MHRGVLLASGICLLGVLGCAALMQHLLTRSAIDTDVVWSIEQGTASRKIVTDLVESHTLDAPAWLVRAWLRVTAARGPLQAGEYALPAGASVAESFAMFRRGDVLQHRITFAEGLTVADWLDRIAAEPRLRQTVAADKRHTLAELLGTNEPIEGRLFPDTYQFPRDTTDVAILRRALRRGQAVLDSEWDQRASDLPIASPHEALILASIVEKETGLAADRARIARVFFNRLERNMRLQSDPTVIYGIEKFDGDLRRSDLRRDGPYNTYMRHGLTPTPICNPGRAAIHATLHPVAGDDIYFVARGDGSSEFSATLEEHNRAVRKYQLGQDE